MQYSSRFALGLIILPLVYAIPQTPSSLSSLPACVASGALEAVQSAGCSLSDTACFCKSSSFMQQLQTLAEQNCSGTDLQTAISLAQTTCASAGVALTTDTTTVTPATAAATATSSDPSTATETDDPTVDTAGGEADSTDMDSDPSTTTPTNTATLVAPYTMSNTTDGTDCVCTASTPCTSSAKNTSIAIYTGAATKLSSTITEFNSHRIALVIGILGLLSIA